MLRAKHFKDGVVCWGIKTGKCLSQMFLKAEINVLWHICTECVEVKMASARGSAGAKKLDHPST